MYNNLNRLTQQRPGGVLRFAGTVNEPATVTIQGRPAVVGPDNAFAGAVSVMSGTNTVTIAAIDGSGNASTQQYQVDASGTADSVTYDANGNLTSDGTRTFEWDARDQLVAVTVGVRRSEFIYDGQQRRIRIVERDDAVVLSDRHVVWCGDTICEERASDGITVIGRSFGQAEHISSTARFLSHDHIGSLREATDASGALLARYVFDAWGRRTLAVGSDLTTLGYTGHRWHAGSSLSLAPYRAYDAELGRWLSEDPAGWADGTNLYQYVRNNPIRRLDPLGLSSDNFCVARWTFSTSGFGAAAGAIAGATVGAAAGVPAGGVGALPGAAVGAGTGAAIG